MRRASVNPGILVLGLIIIPGISSVIAFELPEVKRLLMQARWTHEPTGVIRQAVQLLDTRLDQEPKDREAWRQLGEALAIGNANSRHATSATDAWQQAYELDKTDCHAGALAARWAAASVPGRIVT